jgi:hypothetical protein
MVRSFEVKLRCEARAGEPTDGAGGTLSAGTAGRFLDLSVSLSGFTSRLRM